MDISVTKSSAEPQVINIIEDAQLHISVASNVSADIQLLLESGSEVSVDVLLDDNATATILTIQSGADMNIRQTSQVGAGAKLHWQNISLGGGINSHDLSSEIIGDHGESTVDWMFYAKDSEKQSISARNIFSARNGGGEITMKGVAEDTASVQCNGMINIGSGGTGTDAYLTEDVLMLDSTAKVDALPGLEIKTNDVKASHSATVSRVTSEDLFYFAARGIEEGEARSMYVQGFLGDLVGKIGDDEVRGKIIGRIESKYSR